MTLATPSIQPSLEANFYSYFQRGEERVSSMYQTFLFYKKWTAAQIKAEFDEVHEESALALKTIY